MGSSAEAAFTTAIATVEELSSVDTAMDIGAAIGAAIGATATDAMAPSCPPASTPMGVAVAAMLGATAAVSVSADELGDQAFAAWFGALVQYSALLQFTNPAGPMHAFTLPAVCEPTCAPLLCKWLRVDVYQVVLHPN